MTTTIQFEDGAAYERYMGRWSHLAGEAFLRWLAPPPRLRWLDVGCGNGAFTEMVVEQCRPASVAGIDPSLPQLAYARTRPSLRAATFHQGDAMALPFPDAAFDAAVMPLVIFFLPDPGQGVAEMARVVAPGGIVSSYGWDMTRGGFPYESLFQAMRAMDLSIPAPPSPDASAIDRLQQFWHEAGLEAVATTEILLERPFPSFADYWATVLGAASVGKQLRALSAIDVARLQDRLQAELPTDAAGRITLMARANAVKGYVPPHRS